MKKELLDLLKIEFSSKDNLYYKCSELCKKFGDDFTGVHTEYNKIDLKYELEYGFVIYYNNKNTTKDKIRDEINVFYKGDIVLSVKDCGNYDENTINAIHSHIIVNNNVYQIMDYNPKEDWEEEIREEYEYKFSTK